MDTKTSRDFCRSAPFGEVRRCGYVLTPGRYVGTPPTEDDGKPFADKMQRLVLELGQQQGGRCEAGSRDRPESRYFGVPAAS